MFDVGVGVGAPFAILLFPQNSRRDVLTIDNQTEDYWTFFFVLFAKQLFQ